MLCGIHRRQRFGVVVGESADGDGWRVLWDGLRQPKTYSKRFIEVIVEELQKP